MRKIDYLKIVCLLAVVINTSGCALYSKEFDCKVDKGLGCKSISEVNQLVDNGALKEVRENKSVNFPANAVCSLPIGLSDQAKIQRVQEEHLRVWIAPYQDEQGNFHEASLIHTVIKPGYWQLLERI